jgi:hypothetical protein
MCRKQYSARETDIAEHVIVEFERHAALAAAHPQVAELEEPADDPGAGLSSGGQELILGLKAHGTEAGHDKREGSRSIDDAW